MFPAADISRSVATFPVTDRNFNNHQIQFSDAEQKIKIAERFNCQKSSWGNSTIFTFLLHFQSNSQIYLSVFVIWINV